ncbi:MAG: hypothetical protein R3B45_02520 [Bdellovibrionota bacterium]
MSNIEITKIDWKKISVQLGSLLCSELNIDIGNVENVKLFVAELMSEEERMQSMHAIRSSLRTLESAVANIQEGYHFDDDVADLKVKAIEGAVDSLKPYMKILESFLAI